MSTPYLTRSAQCERSEDGKWETSLQVQTQSTAAHTAATLFTTTHAHQSSVRRHRSLMWAVITGLLIDNIWTRPRKACQKLLAEGITVRTVHALHRSHLTNRYNRIKANDFSPHHYTQFVQSVSSGRIIKLDHQWNAIVISRPVTVCWINTPGGR